MGKPPSKMEFVKSRTWCEEVAIINGVLRPEGPLLPAQAVRPGGHQWANRICEIGPAYVALSRRIVWSTATQA